MTTAEVRGCELSPGAAALLADLYARRRLSGRAHDRSLRLAQTLADLAGAARVGEEEMAQALQLRRRDRV
jgi:magnesium chelatase family protein